MKTPIKTRRKDIVDYWCQRVYEGDMGTDWDEADKRCWRCGNKHTHKNLDRCHIIPEQAPFCGKDEPSNFVLLCKKCHKAAPSVGDKATMFLWIKNTSCGTYGDFDRNRVDNEFKNMYGMTPTEYLKNSGVSISPAENKEEYKILFEKLSKICKNHPVGNDSMQISDASIAHQLKAIIDDLEYRKTFSTFRDASNFARQHAQNIGVTVKLEQKDNLWIVVTNQERKKEEQEQKRRKFEQKARETTAIREREKKRLYLEERESSYRSLPEKQLSELWGKREEMELEPDEAALLREIVREVKGIKPTYGNSAQVCRQCGMVEGNCTCGRSWY